MKTSTFLTDLGCTADVDRSLFEETKIEAEKGDADAQNELGFAYANGEGVVKNEAEAVKWYRKAADQGVVAVVQVFTEEQRCQQKFSRSGRGVKRKGSR